MGRKAVWLSVFSIGVATLSYYGVPYVRTAVLAAAPVKVIPFTAKTMETKESGEGQQKSVELRTIAVNSSGTQVDVLDSLDGRRFGNFSVLDLERKLRVSVDPATQSITTYPQSNRMIETAKRILSSCADDPSAEHRSILGQRVFKRVDNKTTGMRTTRSEQWIAPNLNCFALEEKVAVYRNGRLLGRVVRETVSLVVGEPNPSLFAIPSGFTERPPSAVFKELAQRGTACTACEQTAKILDKAYASHQR